MEHEQHRQELYHEIFGSILDRTSLTPYLLRDCKDWQQAREAASRMLANRGFDAIDPALAESELKRAAAYVHRAVVYITRSLCPTMIRQLKELENCATPRQNLYRSAYRTLQRICSDMTAGTLMHLVSEDPRNLFLLVSASSNENLFKGHPEVTGTVPVQWRMTACAILKVCHLIKSIEEDSQDIHDFACLGFFFNEQNIPLTGLFNFPWDKPPVVPNDEPARRAFVKLGAFFHKLYASVHTDPETGTLFFDSGDGVRVELAEIKARLKSPESMFAKLGKDASEEAYTIRDILAVTFLLKHREESLTLFHSLQKRGVILQENTASASITQTLFRDSADMETAVRLLMSALARSGNKDSGDPMLIDGTEVRMNAENFFKALNTNAELNPHSSNTHRKFQCKITFSVPVHHLADSGHILIPGTAAWTSRSGNTVTRQHTLPVELRISDRKSWETSELRGQAHHAAYKFRQLLILANRIFNPQFSFPEDQLPGLRTDQDILFQ